MTNAEKYLKDGVSTEEFANKLGNFINQYSETFTTYEADILKFLNSEAKPTLTKDEGVIKMIEKLKDTMILKDGYPVGIKHNQIVTTINEIIDKVNELDIKLHTVKLFTPTQDKAVKELLKLLETDNSVGELLK